MNMRRLMTPTMVLALAAAGVPARAQDAASDAAVTAESCMPQPRCRSLYTTMQPGRHFQTVMMHHRMMMHRKARH